MKTFEDFKETQEKFGSISDFLISAINEYKASKEYRDAVDGYNYFCKKNTTIMSFQKFLYEQTGEAIPDNFSANYKFRNSFFSIFVLQEVSHLLGNGITFNDDKTKEALGGAMFDMQVYRALLSARWGGVSYGFLNKDKVNIFTAREFVPLFGEEDGMLRAGIRFWQISANKPMRISFFEEDGVTEYIHKNGETIVLKEKTPYITIVRKSEIGGVEIAGGKNYPSFPIVPLWANEEHTTFLEGIREKIDGYDLIQSGFANDLDEASFLYWTITNAGGMDDIDLKKFIRDMKLLHAAVVDENGSVATPHTMDVPYAARQTGLNELKESLYRDAMALDTDKISAGQITATAIRAAYENLDLKCDMIEMCVTDFIHSLLELLGIKDMPTYKRSRITNVTEETQVVLLAAQYLDNETILKHLPFLSPDEIDTIIKNKSLEESERYGEYVERTGNTDVENNNEKDGSGEDAE